MKEEEKIAAENLKGDRALFGSLLTHVVRASPDEDCASLILKTVGRAVEADRCYAYRFWEPGKSSMCTNTHEWCADGIEPMISGQQTCDLSELEEFNACITSGRDFRFTDIDAIDAGSRKWLAPQGIKSLIAAPIVAGDGEVVGFVGFGFVGRPRGEFSDRVVFSIHAAANLLLVYHRLHERDMVLQDVVGGKNEYEENEREFERALVVDDSPVNRAVLKAMLKKVGITDLELAVDGRAALDVLERDQSFDLVLSDMWMPVMDGTELIRRIRGESRLAHLKVCSITADVESLATYREQGFDALLLKPVTVEKLAELLKNPDLRRPA